MFKNFNSLDVLKKYAQTISQTGTSDLFFDTAQNQISINNRLGSDPDFNTILDALGQAGKSGDKVILVFKAEPGVGASFDIKAPTNKGVIDKLKVCFYKQFKTVTGKDFNTVLKTAAAKAMKDNFGSGSITMEFPI